ncbi:type II secretion system protein GspL [Massilia sp. TSP1-1-2]|uniref:type II secretion system protein GspL n=1 Tax=unclassified Massilia TaxID=2609279 RepID=UPI003CFB8C88
MTTLYIRLPARADSEGALARFALVADGGAVMQQGAGALRSMGDVVAASRRVVLLLAAPDVTLLHVKTPPLSAARLKAALPNLVEEQVLGDPEDCVLVAAPAQLDDGMRTVAVAQRAWLEAIVKGLLAMGARSVSALPSQLCLPLAPGNVSGAIDANGITLRHGLYAGLGLAVAGTPAMALQTARALAGDSPLNLYVETEELGEYQALVAEAGPGIHVEAEHWAHWIAGSKSTHLDLVPGLGAAGAQVRDWKKWRWPLRIALLAVVVNLIGLNVQYMRLKREAQAITLGMTQTFKAAFPKETVISSDPAAQMRQNITRAKAAAGQVTPDEFTWLAAAFGEAARNLPRPPELASMAYREHVLTVKVKPGAADPASAQTLRQVLAARKLALDDSVAGVWTIRNAGASK